MLGFDLERGKAIALIEAELRGAAPDGWTMEAFNDGFLDIEGAIFRDGSTTAYIVFRCTDSTENWFTNFVFVKKSLAYGNKASKVRLHLGFFLDYTGYARGFIHSWLKDHPEVKGVVVAGHSLGGALATLCAVDLQYNFGDRLVGEDAVECITFGSPRVGNKAFVESFNKRVPLTLRYRYANDIVTHLPPVLFGFKHVAATLQLGKPGWPSAKAHELANYKKA